MIPKCVKKGFIERESIRAPIPPSQKMKNRLSGWPKSQKPTIIKLQL